MKAADSGAGRKDQTTRRRDQPEVGSDFVELALEALDIVFNELGDHLMATAKGKRLVEIAREGIALSRRRVGNRTTSKNLDGREYHGDSKLFNETEGTGHLLCRRIVG